MEVAKPQDEIEKIALSCAKEANKHNDNDWYRESEEISKNTAVTAILEYKKYQKKALEKIKSVLDKHHKWHNEIGEVIYPGEGIEIDLSLEYQDSSLCEETIEALKLLEKIL